MEIRELIKPNRINALNGLNFNVLDVKQNMIFLKDNYDSISVKDYFFKTVSCSEQRIYNSLKMVCLSESILEKNIIFLSSTEKLKIEMAILLAQNVDTFYFYQLDQYFIEKELMYFKRLFQKIVKKYKKTFVFIDSKASFLLDFAERIVVKNKRGELEVFVNPDFYDEKLISFIGEPKIVEFVRYVNQKDKKLKNYTDMKELIKAIYREV